MKKRFIAWSKEPIHVPRWMLTMKYFAFAILGLLSFIGGIPTLSIATFDTFTTAWSGGLVVAGTVAAITSIRRSWEGVEKWAALIVAALLFTWAVAAIIRAASEADISRVAGAFAVLVISMLPAARAFGLMRRAGL
jgi:hypothetical protein